MSEIERRILEIAQLAKHKAAERQLSPAERASAEAEQRAKREAFQRRRARRAAEQRARAVSFIAGPQPRGARRVY